MYQAWCGDLGAPVGLSPSVSRKGKEPHPWMASQENLISSPTGLLLQAADQHFTKEERQTQKRNCLNTLLGET